MGFCPLYSADILIGITLFGKVFLDEDVSEKEETEFVCRRISIL